MKNILLSRSLLTLSALTVTGLSFFNYFRQIDPAYAAAPCIVTIFGVQYDVSPLQTSHTGGNIFTCGTDMTATYQGMHGTNVSRIAPFILASTPSPSPSVSPLPTASASPRPSISPSPTPSTSPAPAQHDDDEDDDEREVEPVKSESHRDNHERDEDEHDGTRVSLRAQVRVESDND